uniref:Uncharacterized protein n=1 Tax=Chromera velia CCMP2878 TaxID=1169474 RepID=A0A0G4G835_9ALVE|eukprot:Cvel_20695.t1-p1 / transcript=Cvel_20695.t1 / gene=Cvel_20695 / organism=Chromera_velia_CCMP2878 / gene_product=Ankyrin repeat and SOCS box protein 16, putative / transcript_product=Ankyrin repeat and SOCS box protein 16, putative / location=Cvel_scaffold1883:3655-4134(+) / protein_length=160 / sequence_SO=supercontig / SO=protein_coding / is_pseudo=false
MGVNARTERGHCPLHYAVSLYMENCTETIHILLDAGANVNVKTDEPEGAHLDTPLHFAATFGITEVVELLVAAGAQVSAQNSDGITPLHRTAFPWGEVESRRHAAKVLLDAGADINVLGGRLGGKTPLGWAVRWSNGAVEELLRERGAWALHSWQLERGE